MVFKLVNWRRTSPRGKIFSVRPVAGRDSSKITIREEHVGTHLIRADQNPVLVWQQLPKAAHTGTRVGQPSDHPAYSPNTGKLPREQIRGIHSSGPEKVGGGNVLCVSGRGHRGGWNGGSSERWGWGAEERQKMLLRAMKDPGSEDVNLNDEIVADLSQELYHREVGGLRGGDVHVNESK